MSRLPLVSSTSSGKTSDEQAFTANRLTQPRRVPTVRLSEEDFKRHQDLLQPLMEFISRRGRLPIDIELDVAPKIREIFGGMARAFSLIRRVTGLEQWEAIRHEHRDDLLVYLALAAFGKRPKLGQLPTALRHDIRAFFGTYKAACSEANRLLYSAGDQDAINHACGQAPVGKILPRALYVHHSALSHLPPLLRAYEGCGRMLAGAVDGMTLVKLSRHRPQVSYLVYPDFDRVAHPALTETFVADLSRLNLHHRDYRRSANPPILHRKELFVGADYPKRTTFEKLTRREVALGLLNSDTIHTQALWTPHLAALGLAIKGHRLVKIH